MTGEGIPLHWRVHTPNLLKEVLENPSCAILSQPLNIFGKLLAMVAERAINLDDQELNKLMLRLTLYDQADPASPGYDPQAITQMLRGDGK